MAARRIVIVAFPDVQPLDVAGAAGVFSAAARFAPGAYDVRVVAPTPDPVSTGAGCAIAPAGGLHPVRGRIDTLVVAGGEGTRKAVVDERLVPWIAAAARR